MLSIYACEHPRGGPQAKTGGRYFEPKTRSNSAVSPAVWNLVTLPSALKVKTSAVSAVSPGDWSESAQRRAPRRRTSAAGSW